MALLIILIIFVAYCCAILSFMAVIGLYVERDKTERMYLHLILASSASGFVFGLLLAISLINQL